MNGQATWWKPAVGGVHAMHRLLSAAFAFQPVGSVCSAPISTID